MKRLKRLLKRGFKIISLEEMRILPGQLAFFIVIAIFSILPLIAEIGSNFLTTELIESFSNLPSGVSDVFKNLMTTDINGYNIAMFFIISIYFASDGAQAMIITSNVIYKMKNNSIIKQKIKSLIMIIILIFLIFFVVLIPAFGDLILKSLKTAENAQIIDKISNLYQFIKYPISIVLIFIGVKILYTMAPDEPIGSKTTSRGAMFTSIFWVLVTRIYAIYLNNINTYDIFYGSLANIVIILFWIYILCYIFTFGMAINAEHYFEEKKENKEKLEEKVE